MEEILKDVVSDEELKKFERNYFDQLGKTDQPVSLKTRFEYAWCLVRSKYPADIKKGIILLENLYNQDVEGRREYLYFLTIGNIRIQEYSKALKFCRIFLEIEPNNAQVQELEDIIKRKLNKEGTIGIAITMGAIFAVGCVVALGRALVKNTK